MPRPAKGATLSAEQLAFLQSGVAIDLATRDEHHAPRLARGLGCRVGPRGQVTVFMANRLADDFLHAVTTTRTIAAVFCLASTHRAIQLKGSDAAVAPARKTDRQIVERVTQAFAVDIACFGLDERFARAEMTYRPEELMAITFTPDVVFEQTPGPSAGTRL